jgi:transposase
VAFVALLMAHFRQSKRRVSLFCESVLNTPCSPGLAVKLQNRATAALRPVYDELVRALPKQKLQNIDESPTKEANRKAWLWTFVAKDFSVFAIRPTRGGEVLDELLTDRFRGIVTCDRAKMYWRLPTLQWCWAHLKRDFQALADSSVRVAKELGKKLLEEVGVLFRQYSRCRDGTISCAGLKSSLGKTRRAVERLLLRGLSCRHARTSEVCRELYWYRRRLWTFLDHAGVEPTNNASERALRHAVIWRKLSFGTQSAAGSRFVETLLSAIETCRQQDRDVFAFVTQAVEHHFAHRRTPSLLAGV